MGEMASVCVGLLGSFVMWGKEIFKKFQRESGVVSTILRLKFTFNSSTCYVVMCRLC